QTFAFSARQLLSEWGIVVDQRVEVERPQIRGIIRICLGRPGRSSLWEPWRGRVRALEIRHAMEVEEGSAKVNRRVGRFRVLALNGAGCERVCNRLVAGGALQLEQGLHRRRGVVLVRWPPVTRAAFDPLVIANLHATAHWGISGLWLRRL